MSHPRVLIQLDTDRCPSSFDAIVALDSGVDQMLSYAGVQSGDVPGIVHGAMFTRGGAELAGTALFIGGRDIQAAGALAAEVERTFFGPLRVSWMLDPNGANTTAVAAVLTANRHIDPAHTTWLILGGTGPVGQRIARLAAAQDSRVLLASRSLERAQRACQSIGETIPAAKIEPLAVGDSPGPPGDNVEVVIAAGAAGTELLAHPPWNEAPNLKVAIDLNAVPPSGIRGIDPGDSGQQRGRCACYGAIGVGKSKMKIHRHAIRTLFTANNWRLDAESILELARQWFGADPPGDKQRNP